MRGKPVILNNCENHIDNIITPLMHHRNTANPKDEDEGKSGYVLKMRTLWCIAVILFIFRLHGIL